MSSFIKISSLIVGKKVSINVPLGTIDLMSDGADDGGADDGAAALQLLQIQ